MESLLILIGIFVLDAIIKGLSKRAKSRGRKEEFNTPDDDNQDYTDIPDDLPGDLQQNSRSESKRSLEDLIRQFNETQRESSQGTFAPEAPLPDEMDEDENEEELDLPVVTPATPGQITFREIAESVIQWESVSIAYLQQAFGFTLDIAKQVLADLQEHRIAGRDMGDGQCDLLVHSKTELENLFKKEQREKEEQQAQAERELEKSRQAEIEAKRQKELSELVNPSNLAKDIAGSQTEVPTIESSSLDSRPNQIRHFNTNEIRRGFIWAKVIDEPRFKRKWSARTR